MSQDQKHHNYFSHQSSHQDSYFKHVSQNEASNEPSGSSLQYEQSKINMSENTLSYSNASLPSSSQYQFLIYENKIQILNDRLQCYMQQVQNLKKTNKILLNKLSTIEQLDQELQRQIHKNLQLRQQIQIYRDKIEEESQKNERKVQEIARQLKQKQNFVDLMRHQHEKVVNKKEQQISFLRDTLKEKISKLQQCEKKLHSIEIQRLNSQQDYNTGRESYMARTSISYNLNSQNDQNTNTMNMQKNTISVQQKARHFMKKDPHQLKIMMRSLSNAQKCLQIGGQQLSMIGCLDKQQQRSMILAGSMLTKSKINKTYYK